MGANAPLLAIDPQPLLPAYPMACCSGNPLMLQGCQTCPALPATCRRPKPPARPPGLLHVPDVRAGFRPTCQPRGAAPMPPEPTSALPARGYFGIGAERISKALNLGNLMRSAHGFGASFTFTIGGTYAALEARADTSKGAQHLPHYDWKSVHELALPTGCRLVGIELLDEAIDLPSFHHPPRAAYVLGPERGALS